MVEISSITQEALGSVLINQVLRHKSVSPALESWRQKVRVILSYKASFRLAWAAVPFF